MKCFVKAHLTLGFLLLLFRIAKSDNSDEDDKEEEEFGGVNIKVFRGPSKKNGNESFAPFGYHVKMPPIHSSKSLKKKVVNDQDDQEKPFDFNSNEDEPFDFSSHESDLKKETSDEQDQNEEQFGFNSNEHDKDEKDLSKEHEKDDDDFSGEHHEPNAHNKPFDGSEEGGDSNEELDFENQERSNRYNHFHNYNKDNHPKPRHHDYLNVYNNDRDHRSKPLNYVSKNYDHHNLDQNVPFVGESTNHIKKKFNDFNIRPDGVFGRMPSHSVGESHDRYKKSDGSIIPSSTTNRYYNKYEHTIPTDSTLKYYNQDREYKSGILPAAIPAKNYNYNHYKEYRRSLSR
ncbi:probable serine/threonine-protein kinase clkA [Parasteatoda tepidariorum]|uniref:probable serine/threonine-protein kinase clkA n=1 Tax=Parasteatoda tepidariorum TaxID=114398 RepID=UPI001C71FBA7|nr:GATA zinc finger domain-containing protein 14-like [Parasteatoda tepidariorum]